MHGEDALPCILFGGIEMEAIRVAILGAGSRGMHVYGEFAMLHPELMKVVSVAEPDKDKLKQMQDMHQIPDALAFHDWKDLFENMPDIDAVIITTQDRMHIGPIKAAMKKNVHILCEKPIVPTKEECQEIERESKNFKKLFIVGHVLRYTSFYARLKQLIVDGEIGKLIGMDLNESVGHIHMSHSFVRGHWGNKEQSSPMILAKSCHDLDMMLWLAGADCTSVSSYGQLNYFKASNAPVGAPKRCLDGCPHEGTCPYHVRKIYLGQNTNWPVNVICNDMSLEGRIEALKTGPWGRCVFQCDNDVVDHEVVSAAFANGVTATFTMSGFTMKTHRNIKLYGTTGEIVGDMEESKITISDFSTGEVKEICLPHPAGGHSGGDGHLIADFVSLVQSHQKEALTTASHAVQSHFMAFASEESRLQGGKMINLQEFRKS
jgi:predicted dehydrogenase